MGHLFSLNPRNKVGDNNSSIFTIISLFIYLLEDNFHINGTSHIEDIILLCSFGAAFFHPKGHSTYNSLGRLFGWIIHPYLQLPKDQQVYLPFVAKELVFQTLPSLYISYRLLFLASIYLKQSNQ